MQILRQSSEGRSRADASQYGTAVLPIHVEEEDRWNIDQWFLLKCGDLQRIIVHSKLLTLRGTCVNQD
jgi:hypothetical protein